jgi:hypothetical protein
MLSTASVLLETFSATGTPSSSTFLRGDNVWAALPPEFDISTVTNQKLFTTSSVTFANLTVTNTATITTATISRINIGTATNYLTFVNNGDNTYNATLNSNGAIILTSGGGGQYQNYGGGHRFVTTNGTLDLNLSTSGQMSWTGSSFSAGTGLFTNITVSNTATLNTAYIGTTSVRLSSFNLGVNQDSLILQTTRGISLNPGIGTVSITADPGYASMLEVDRILNNDAGFVTMVDPVTFQQGFTANTATITTATITNLAFGNTSTTQVGFAANILGNGVGNGALLYQASPNTTGFLGQGSAGWLLVSGGSGQNPAFTSTGSIFVGNANKSTNIAGGSANRIPYQTAADTTNFIGTPTTTGTYLTWTGSDFAWNTISDQALFTTSSVVFAAVTATTGTFATLNATTVTFTTLQATTGTFGGKIITGGFPIASVSTLTGSIISTNYTAIQRPGINIRSFRSNYPANETGFGTVVLFESARGTGVSPTVPLSGDTLGGLNFGGWDGATWSMDNQLPAFGFIVFAGENWAGNATTSTNVGTGFLIRSQPSGMRLDANSRQRLIQQSWTTYGDRPPTANLVFGAAQNIAPTLTRGDGSATYTGYGAMSFTLINGKFTTIGVPNQDSAPDNITLPGTNSITLVGGRRSGVSGRRDALLVDDELGFIDFRGQTAPNGTGNGSSGALIKAIAAENFSGSAVGTSLVFATANTGTTTLSNKLVLNSLGVQINNAFYLPTTDGTANQIITTNGAGQASWANANPFDQALFTTSSVTFANLTITNTATVSQLVATYRNETNDENKQPTAVFGDLEIYSEYAAVGEVSRVYLRNTATYGTVILQNMPANEESDNLLVDWSGFAATRFSTSTNITDYAYFSNGVDNYTVRFGDSSSGETSPFQVDRTNGVVIDNTTLNLQNSNLIGTGDTFVTLATLTITNTATITNLVFGNTSTTQVGYAADVLGGEANQIVYQVGANDTGFVEAPTTATTYLAWTGTNYMWSSPFTSGGTFTDTITIKGLKETQYSWGSVGAGTYSPDVSSGTVQKMTLTGNITINTLTNATTGSSVNLILTQDGTGGRTLTSTMKFAGANKTLSTAASSIDVITIYYDGTNYLASLVKGYA